MNPANIVDIIKDVKERLTLDGKNKVFNEGKELRSEFMKEKDILNGEKGVSLFYHDSGESYWTKLLTYEPKRIRGGKEVKPSHWFGIKVNQEYADFVTCVINSTLFYWFWLCAQKLMKCYKENSYFVEKRKGYKSLEFKVNRCKKLINEIDSLIGEIYGLTDEEMEYLIGYDLEMRTEKDWNKDKGDTEV